MVPGVSGLQATTRRRGDAVTPGHQKGVIPASPRLRVFLSLWLPVAVWCGAIFYLSHIPNLRITQEWWDIIARKIAHMVEFGILARLLVRALSGSTPWPRKKIILASLAMAVLYACSDEYHQGFVVGRTASPMDVLIDASGAWLALRFFR